MQTRRTAFGFLEDGTVVEAVELVNGAGMSARVITLGACLQSLLVPDRDGRLEDVVLGHDTPGEYLASNQFFGATAGRYANRIAGGRFSLDGESYRLETNNGPNHLHGGVRGLDKVVWEIEGVEEGEAPSVTLRHVSPDGAGGYPGTLSVRATYALRPDNLLAVSYEATTDRPTIVNITNHSYYNLAGPGAGVMDHLLTIEADAFTPVDATLIPTGELRAVEGTPFDFRSGAPVGSRIRDAREEQLLIGRGYDHNFALNGGGGQLKRAARLEDPLSGRVMELFSDQPGLQFYSGNFLDGSIVGKGGRIYRQGDGLCLEPQLFPDTPNQSSFPSARLDPGQIYRHAIELRFH